jgi:hypothetical protein
MLSAVQLLPVWEYVSQSNLGTGHLGYLVPSDMIVLLVSDFFGNPARGNYWGPYNYSELIGGYVGPLALFLALVAVVHKTRDRRVLFFTALSLLSLGVTYGFPGFLQVVALLPPFNLTLIQRGSFVFAFSAALLAGFGLDLLLHGSLRILKTSTVAVVLIALMVAPFLYSLRYYGSVLQFFGRGRIGRVSISDITINVLFLIAMALLCILRKQSLVTRRTAYVTVLIALLASSYMFAYVYNPQVKPFAESYPETDAITFLLHDSSAFRVVGLGCCTIPPDTAMTFRLDDAGIYDSFTLIRYSQLASVAGFRDTEKLQVSDLQIGGNASASLLDLLNVKYIITSPYDHSNLTAADRGLSLIYAGPDARIWLNRSVLPRAFMIYSIVVIPNDGEALAKIQRNAFDFKQVAIMDETVPHDVESSMNTSVLLGKSEASMSAHSINRFAVIVNSASPGLLVISENWYPGWAVYVDGRPSTLYRVDYSFMGVFLQTGTHIVEFVYDPASYRLGMYLTILSSVIIALMVAYQIRRNRSCVL